ncbi:hypothetical protein CYLTODRAFT_485185 [Cylindrobasidium torrendii FP15055 ss-10]|uniref:BRCT domain-containing protein n=1 Tax=Cylindrobasidium torrendii FP15055 ss-10 TaxID=1314674 RepID=A0A0D7BT23_9AGAR|nr:hypothetical protein CYLTODRAFT_485185 [Cylindrobasidium torrendii FP15055 ss-10]
MTSLFSGRIAFFSPSVSASIRQRWLKHGGAIASDNHYLPDANAFFCNGPTDPWCEILSPHVILVLCPSWIIDCINERFILPVDHYVVDGPSGSGFAPQFPPELNDRTFAFDSFDADATLINDEIFFDPIPPLSISRTKLTCDAPSHKSRNKRLYDLVDKSREGDPRAFKRARTAKKHGEDTISLSPQLLKSLDASPSRSPPLNLHHHRSSIKHVDLTTLKFPRTEALVKKFCAQIRAQLQKAHWQSIHRLYVQGSSANTGTAGLTMIPLDVLLSSSVLAADTTLFVRGKDFKGKRFACRKLLEM